MKLNYTKSRQIIANQHQIEKRKQNKHGQPTQPKSNQTTKNENKISTDNQLNPNQTKPNKTKTK
jgi:hypothetical protein